MEKHKKEMEDFRAFQERKKKDILRRQEMHNDCKCDIYTHTYTHTHTHTLNYYVLIVLHGDSLCSVKFILFISYRYERVRV